MTQAPEPSQRYAIAPQRPDRRRSLSRTGDPRHPPSCLYGFPTSSHMFRNLIPLLANHYHVVAPDLPGFGFTVAPDRTDFTYSFDTLPR